MNAKREFVMFFALRDLAIVTFHVFFFGRHLFIHLPVSGMFFVVVVVACNWFTPGFFGIFGRFLGRLEGVKGQVVNELWRLLRVDVGFM